MALVIQNTKSLRDSKNLKLKILLIGTPGFGKTSFLKTCPNLGVGVSETGHGKGLLSVATSDIDFVEISNYADFDSFCSGVVFKDKETLAIDSLSDMARTFIKDKAISIPRAKGDSQKRLLGVPELDDYGVIAELTRKLTKKFIDQPKHIICTATLRIDKPDLENGQGEMLIGPDFPGARFLGCTAMFDLLRDPKDAKSRYTERYWLTENQGGFIAKNRLSVDVGSFLPTELQYDLKTGNGTFKDILNRAVNAYAAFDIKQAVLSSSS